LELPQRVPRSSAAPRWCQIHVDNDGQITSLTSPNWVRRQHYSVTRVRGSSDADVLATNLACPPCNVGPRSIPDYASLANAAVHSLGGGIKWLDGSLPWGDVEVTAGQVAELDRR
jgi:hypothetical protein